MKIKSEKLLSKYQELKQATDGLMFAFQYDFAHLSNLEQDLIKNGQIQKFEYNLELLWKFMKSHLHEEGNESSTPKEVMKNYFYKLEITENEKIQLLSMIDDRNRIAHEYKDIIMEQIYPRLTDHSKLIIAVVDKLNKS